MVVIGAGTIIFLSLLVHGMAGQEAADAAKPKDTRQEPLQVIILEPLVQFEDVRGGSIVPKGASDDQAFGNRLLAAARSEMEIRKLGIVKPESFPDLIVGDECARLQRMASRLARGNITEEATEIMKRLASVNDRYAVLVQFMRVKAGPGGSWNPNTGSITSAINSTLLQTALIGCRTGLVHWKNEVFVRKTFRPDSPEFTKNLGLLYQTPAAK